MKRRTALFCLSGAALALMSLLATGCKVGYPFRGPGYDPARGITHAQAGPQVLVAITTGIVQRGAGQGFSKQLRSVMDSMASEDGLIGYTVRRELFGSRVWTMSVWTGEAALQRFLRGSSHREAVTAGGIARETVYSASYWLKADHAPPTWKAALKELDQQNPDGYE